MSDPFLGEINIFPYSFAPKNWAECNGQILPITQNPALAALLGDLYGPRTQTEFTLPDLRGRVPLGMGVNAQFYPTTTYKAGNSGGVESVTLSASQLPYHSHAVTATSAVGTANANPGGLSFAVGSEVGAPYTAATQLIELNESVIGAAGGGSSHMNMQPYLALRFCIATTGIWPSRW